MLPSQTNYIQKINTQVGEFSRGGKKARVMTVQATSEDTLSSPMKVFLKAGKIKVVPWEFIPGFDDALELGKAAAENIAATAVELGVPAVAPAPVVAPVVAPVKQRKRGANIAKPTVPLAQAAAVANQGKRGAHRIALGFLVVI